MAVGESGIHHLSTSYGGSREVSVCLGAGHVVCLRRSIGLNNSSSL